MKVIEGLVERDLTPQQILNKSWSLTPTELGRSGHQKRKCCKKEGHFNDGASLVQQSRILYWCGWRGAALCHMR